MLPAPSKEKALHQALSLEDLVVMKETTAPQLFRKKQYSSPKWDHSMFCLPLPCPVIPLLFLVWRQLNLFTSSQRLLGMLDAESRQRAELLCLRCWDAKTSWRPLVKETKVKFSQCSRFPHQPGDDSSEGADPLSWLLIPSIPHASDLLPNHQVEREDLASLRVRALVCTCTCREGTTGRACAHGRSAHNRLCSACFLASCYHSGKKLPVLGVWAIQCQQTLCLPSPARFACSGLAAIFPLWRAGLWGCHLPHLFLINKERK